MIQSVFIFAIKEVKYDIFVHKKRLHVDYVAISS